VFFEVLKKNLYYIRISNPDLTVCFEKFFQKISKYLLKRKKRSLQLRNERFKLFELSCDNNFQFLLLCGTDF